MPQTPKVTAYRVPGTLADDATIGTIAWSNPTNAASSNDVYASAAISTTTDLTIEDEDIKIVKGGTISGTNQSADADWPNPTDNVVTFGSASNLWGVTLKATDVNASTFGFVIACRPISDGTPISHYLQATNFGFTLPSSSKVVGVEARVERSVLTSVSSFVEGTEISTPTGVTSIEKIRRGSRVISYNTRTMKFERDRVVNIKSRVVKEVVGILTSRHLVYTTPNHRFFSSTGLIRAKDIRVGSKLYTFFTGIPVLHRVEDVNRHKGHFQVFDFQTEKNHSYVANGFVVHNKIISTGFTTAQIDYMEMRVHYQPLRDPQGAGIGGGTTVGRA